MAYTITRAQRDVLRAEALAELAEIDVICNTVLRQRPSASVSGAVEPLPGDVAPEG